MTKLYKFVKDNIEAGSTVLDAYSGIGSIALYIADKAGKVFAVEENQTAVKDSNFNAQLNKITNVNFIYGKVEDKISNIWQTEEIDALIFDPPRKGLDHSIISTVSNSKIGKIIYVSCNPATQLRDVQLLEQAGYRVKSISPFDMFPHTYHIENVVILVKS
jgi:23S rRNA (uracil1939-C5)-methyltransferase